MIPEENAAQAIIASPCHLGTREDAFVLADNALAAVDYAVLAADAARFRYLRDHHYYRYAMTQEQPMECGIQWEFQQSKPGESTLSLEALIDRDIERAKRAEEEDKVA